MGDRNLIFKAVNNVDKFWVYKRNS